MKGALVTERNRVHFLQQDSNMTTPFVYTTVTDAELDALKAAARGKSLHSNERWELEVAIDRRRREFHDYQTAKREAVCAARHAAARKS